MCYHKSAIKKMTDYEIDLHKFARKVESDMKATETVMDILNRAEHVLTEEVPFNKDQWDEMMMYLKTVHLFSVEV